MGITEDGRVSAELKAIDVKILQNKECLQNQRYEFRKYITVGSFCGKGVEGLLEHRIQLIQKPVISRWDRL